MQSVLDFLFGAATTSAMVEELSWSGPLVFLHATSRLLIAAAYLVIPIAIVVYIRRRGDVAPEYRKVAILFAALVAASSVANLISLVTLWLPLYGLHGIIIAVAAILAVIAAVMIWPLMPRLLSFPSAATLLSANERLAEETQARRELVSQLQRVNRDLEERVARRTQELREATQRFEVALYSSGITASVQDRDLRYKWIHNPRLGMTVDEVLGRTDQEILPQSVAYQVIRLKQAVIADGEGREEEIRVAGTAGSHSEETFVRLHVAPELDADGQVIGVICALVDITMEHRKAADLEQATIALAEANDRFDQALNNSPITMFQQDMDLRYTWMFNPPAGMSVSDFLGRSDEEVLPEATNRVINPAKRNVLDNGVPERIEVSWKAGDRLSWYDVRMEPLFDKDVVVGLTSVAIDISAQKEYHHHLRMVMRELTHRSKNLLAVVQGIARQTAQSVDALPSFVDRFGARLQALARAHDILVDESWRGAAIEELIATQLGHVVERTEDRIIAAGPKVLLKPEAAQNLALALHELSTNAAKYGALSTDSGTVLVEWGPVSGIGADTGEPMFEIAWTERGGPPAIPPTRKGFGSVMIERLVPRAIDGTAHLEYDEAGMRWRLRFPSRYLVDISTKELV